MLYCKENLIGLDKSIYYVQKSLDENLRWQNIDIYGKCELTERSGGKVLEYYKGKNEYIQPFFNDKINATIGFEFVSFEHENVMKANVNLICTCNLNKLYSNNDREDQKAIMQVRSVLRKSKYTKDITSVKVGIDEVFRNYDKTKFLYRDMNPFFVFSIGLSLNVFEKCNY